MIDLLANSVPFHEDEMQMDPVTGMWVPRHKVWSVGVSLAYRVYVLNVIDKTLISPQPRGVWGFENHDRSTVK
jgi:hypothetical protein